MAKHLLSFAEMLRVTRHLELHREKHTRQTMPDIVADVSAEIGKPVTDANIRTALKAAGLYDEWKKFRPRAPDHRTNGRAAKQNGYRLSHRNGTKENTRRIEALEAAVASLCRELGVPFTLHQPTESTSHV